MIGAKVENARKVKQLSQKELAEKIGMTVHGLRNAISNNDFKFSTLQKISEVLEVPITYFIDDEDFPLSGNNIAIGDNSNITQGKKSKGTINYSGKVPQTQQGQSRSDCSELELENKYLKQKVKDQELLIEEKDSMIEEKERMIEEKERMIQLLLGNKGK